MKVRGPMLGTSFLTIISLIFLAFVLTNIDPNNADISYFILFYLSFFIAIAGLFILAGYEIRKLFVKNKIPFRLFRASFRQGILISIILTGILLMQSFRVLKLWTGGLMIIIIIVLEIYFAKRK